MRDLILEILYENDGEYRKFINSIIRSNRYIDLRKEIYLCTNFLPEDVNLNERVYCIINGITERVLCKNCKKILKFCRGKYAEFCSGKCVGIYNSDKIGMSNKKNYLIKGSEINEKRRQTSKNRYNVDNVMKLDVIKNKVKKSIKSKTGYEFALQSEHSRNKYKETCLSKYGFDNPSKSDSIKKKKENKCLVNYGVSNWFKTKESRDRLNKSLKEVYDVHNASQLGKGTYSKISQNIFWKIYNRMPSELREKTYFAELNKEFVITEKNANNHYFYDFVISKIKLCIEFNGDRWHANPKLFQKEDKPMSFIDKTASQIWDKDKIKLDSIKERGYEVLIIWESELDENTVDNIIKIITEKYNDINEFENVS